MPANTLRHGLLFTLLFATAGHAADLIGTTIPPDPSGLRDSNSACVAGSALGPTRSCDYAVGILSDNTGKPTLIYGARQVGHDGHGNALWKILDTLPYPKVAKQQTLAIATCALHGENDEAVLAVVRAEDAEWQDKASWARRFDVTSGKFAQVPVADVRCVNEGWGL